MKYLSLPIIFIALSTFTAWAQLGNTAYGVGTTSTRGGLNSSFGLNAGKKMNSSAFANTFIGASAGMNVTSGEGNTLVGRRPGFNTTTGSYNTFLGYQAGYNSNGSSNIFIGREAGYSETGSNKLYIDNSNTTTPLIYGDFSSNQLGINTIPGTGFTLDVGGNLRANGSLTLNEAGYIDDDATFGGQNDDWIRLRGYIELKSNTDSYGIVLRNRDANDYFALTQVDGSSYLTESSTHGNYFIRGTNRDTYFGGKAVTTRRGISGTYNSSQVQGIWSIGTSWAIDETNNNFGNQYGLVYAHTNSGQGISGWGHQIMFVNNGIMNASTSLNYGHGYFKGNLGVGVTNPQEKLHVNGNIRGNQSGGALRIQSTHGWVDVGPRNGSWAHFSTDRPRYYFNKGITVDQGLIGSYNEDLRLQTSGTTRITVSNTSGNVGIGTTTPAYKLDVSGPVNATEFRVNGQLLTIPPQYWNQTGTDIDYSAGNVGIGTATPAHTLDVNGAINATEIRLNGEIFNPTVWNQSGTDINYTGGTVSIGTAVVPLDYKLAVDGNIVAEEVQVLLSDIWPDYVFEEDYELQPLEEVERFVKAHKHLPEVPSAEEVAEEGQGLGKMNTILLRKVEELTLYLIEQQKTIQVQESRIEELYQKLEPKND